MGDEEAAAQAGADAAPVGAEAVPAGAAAVVDKAAEAAAGTIDRCGTSLRP
jgi:hypothetical protein